ncbi:serine/threonine kinase [Crocosphaera subtropica ATCC 51142]|uniref:non-specific serine/threonine protein kinase n=1 Tax=Crocosphaera subtropica (strain ATCC 51142 / BH68) TaxID=43989 RepID=B1WZQ1_CROS5|nr:serine/threonine-protein kinase [Crocosphaera subtropica]ACB51203.1 serine/threonine kinase [Crocosphaera subtropica ATCC 51142]
MNQVGSNTLVDRYQIEQEIGNGGFGVTFLAKDTRMPSERKVVIKKLKPINQSNVDYEIIKNSFQKEAAVLEELGRNHPNIPELYDYFEDEGEFYLVQEYIEGKTLAEISPISQERTFSILTSLLRTLQYIQDKNLIHRDIKPENIIIRSSDGLPVLIDFGAVKDSMGKVRRSSGSVISSVIIGTRGFMSPEQSVGRPTFSSDLYSLGFTMIYALTDKLPVEFEPHPQTGELDWKKYIPNLDPTLEKVLDKAIQDDRSHRYATADEMYQYLHSSQPKKSIKPTEIIANNVDYNSTPPPPTPPLPTTVIDPTPPINTANFNVPETKKQGNLKTASLVVLGGITVLGVAISSYWLTDMITELKAEIDSNNQTITQLEDTVKEKDGQIEQLENELKNANSKTAEITQELTKTKSNLGELSNNLAATQGQLSQAQKTIKDFQDSERIAARYDSSRSSVSSRPDVSWKPQCGSPNNGEKVWWAVKTDGYNLSLVKNNYCGDAMIYSRGETQVASFTSKYEAESFAKMLNAHSGEPFWIRESVRQ